MVDVVWDVPVQEAFPPIGDFAALVREDGRFGLGAGELSDGLIVPLFATERAAEAVLGMLADDPRANAWKVERLGDPSTAMRKAASEGAAGFQLDTGTHDENARASGLQQAKGRYIFPFMVRMEEAGAQWPTILGTAINCDAGVYLTRRGEARFGPHDLRQWRRWDVMDRASAEMAVAQPLRSHDPGRSFWCLAHSAGAVFYRCDGETYEVNGPAVVLFARDNALGPYVPPEGYYPVFTSEESAEEFLRHRLGGAFHILSIGKADGNYVMHQGLMAQDLGPEGALVASITQIDDLPRHLMEVREEFALHPYMKFVVNPHGHREDIAWGYLSDIEINAAPLKSVGGRWMLSSAHQYKYTETIDQFDGTDTFFMGPSEYRFSDLGRSLGDVRPIVDEVDLRECSRAEADEILRAYLASDTDHGCSVDEVLYDIDDEAEVTGEQVRAACQLAHRWVLNHWETVDGERMGPVYFETPFELIRALWHLEVDDRQWRVRGARGHASIGFDGSGNPDLEDSVGHGFQEALVRLAIRIVDRGYRPGDGADLLALANATLKSTRVTVCGLAGDMLVSLLPTDTRPMASLAQEIGLPVGAVEQVLASLMLTGDPEGDRLLRDRVGESVYEALLPRSRLFVSTALLQLSSFGNSPCVDYAPVSVQIVKALEYELRELMAACVTAMEAGLWPAEPTREEQTLLDIRLNRRDRVSLGSITYAIRKAARAPAGPLAALADQLKKRNVEFLMVRRTTEQILGDVLERYRNGGAHEHAISRETCVECVDTLLGSSQSPGLLARVAGWGR